MSACAACNAQRCIWAYASSSHDVHATVNALYATSYQLPGTRKKVAHFVFHCMQTHGWWDGQNCRF